MILIAGSAGILWHVLPRVLPASSQSSTGSMRSDRTAQGVGEANTVIDSSDWLKALAMSMRIKKSINALLEKCSGILRLL